jgi:hypothetical protein
MIVNRYRTKASDPNPATPQPRIGETIPQTTEEISKTREKVPGVFLLPPGDKLKKNAANTFSCLPMASNIVHGYQFLI